MKVLVCNRGSSTLKSRLFDCDPAALPAVPPLALWEANVDWTASDSGTVIEIETSDGRTACSRRPAGEKSGVTVAFALDYLSDGPARVIDSPRRINLVGHRVVHGGPKYRRAVVITDDVKEEITRLSAFAPLHNPLSLEVICAVEEYLGSKTPQVAVFDTAFHAGLPERAYLYPLPYALLGEGIRRYGFHGISNEYCLKRAGQILSEDVRSKRIVICHLGNGCSLTAIKEGRSIDTTMGFTPLDGVMMGSRSGSVDPGILIHLLRQKSLDHAALDDLLNKRSGLLGVSGVSSDMRAVMQAVESGDARAETAIELFVYRLSSGLGSMIAALNGLDILVFTAGIGEHSAFVRQKVAEGFHFLSLRIDQEKNEGNPVDVDIACADSKVRVLVIHTQEDWEIACQSLKVISG